MKYKQWREGCTKPQVTPANCEVYVDGRWVKEDSNPRLWGFLTRRWPVQEVKPKAKAKREIEYVYWSGEATPPATLPKGCEYLYTRDNKWYPENNKYPSNWHPYFKRRWPKPNAKPVCKAGPSVADVLARIRKHADAGAKDHGCLAMNYIKAECDTIEKG